MSQQDLVAQRTLLRPFEAEDAAEAFSWFSDPDLMRFIPLGPDRTLEDPAARLSRYIAHQDQNGFSKWVIVDKEPGRLLGDPGFHFLPDGKRVELRYRLARGHWGKGTRRGGGSRWCRIHR